MRIEGPFWIMGCEATLGTIILALNKTIEGTILEKSPALIDAPQ